MYQNVIQNPIVSKAKFEIRIVDHPMCKESFFHRGRCQLSRWVYKFIRPNTIMPMKEREGEWAISPIFIHIEIIQQIWYETEENKLSYFQFVNV